jgi:hypothetical protein
MYYYYVTGKPLAPELKSCCDQTAKIERDEPFRFRTANGQVMLLLID